MHLKHLEVSGFKSFADNIHLDFEPGITAVVGPNGCGKSNIIDAIRWCLGEMSAKSLRSNLMMDVVFNGSGARPPQNMAQVTLTFDNSDKRLPIDFSDVSISRRLFRSGESEYFINKTQCRLRDIKELFLDTGMGEDGYSSLEQGKVEWVLQAKPEERRELFEEAAGVSKYRARREEALRKLDRVEIDLSRLADIVNVTQDQIRKLENAVNKAKTYQRIKEELKNMEVADWLFQLSNTDSELTDIHKRLEVAQSSVEELNTQSHQFETELTQERTRLTELEEELLTANGHLHKIESNIKIGEERLNSSRQREQELIQQREILTANQIREGKRLEELSAQKLSFVQALTQVQSQGDSIESEYSSSKIAFETSQKSVEENKRKIKESRDKILDQAQERARIHQQLNHLTSDMTRITSSLENLGKEKEKARARLEETRQSLQVQDENVSKLSDLINSFTSRLDEILGRSENLNLRIAELNQKRHSQMNDIAHLKARISTIQDQRSQDPYAVGTQNILSNNFPGIYGPLGRLFQCAESDRELVVSTFGEHLGDLVADSAEEADRAIQFLRENSQGRARIWILDKLSPSTSDEGLGFFSAGASLISRIQTESKFQPLLAALGSSLWVQGSTIYGKAVINGGADPSNWKTQLLHRLPEFQSELETKEKEHNELLEAIHLLETETVTISNQKENLLKEMEESRVRLQMAKEESSKVSRQRDLIQEELLTIDVEIEQAEKTKTSTKEHHDESVQLFNNLQSQEQTDHQNLDQLQHELTELQQSFAVISAEMTSKEERRKAFQEKLNWQTSILRQAEQDLQTTQNSLVHYDQSLIDCDKQLEQCQTLQKESSQLIETSIQERTTAAEECSRIQKTRVEISEKIQATEIKVSALRTEIKSAQESIQTELIKESTLKNRNELLSQKLRDQYELSMDEAKVQFAPAATDIESLDRLKKRVANMGPINLAAPQEHAELVEKATFLTTQQNDLLKAKDDLKQVISKINATTREHFRETFQKVRENFRTLYGKLFQGWEADLKFTDETDILNTGIDIFCQPPGKKLLHISLLSGGEKALTAIALLFAFFQVRPSPVALLDEVDAPLDEANVLRYVDMIKTFSEKSQFILISHNKRTMEAANCLYGVTMEELGVSKVLSARLKVKEAPVEPAAVPA